MRDLLARTTTRLADAGVASPRADAEQLVAHVLGVPRGRLLLADPPEDESALEDLVTRRAAREPLQHLLGTAVLGPVEVAVGPGVFVPRPETEVLLEWALGRPAAVVVDLCTGTGALALAIARGRPDAAMHAVEVDPGALTWTRRNLAGSRVVLHEADVTAPGVLTELDGAVDLVVCNPPYVPEGPAVPPEVDADPHGAVFAGADGLAVIRPVAALAHRLLRPGGAVGVEHDDSHPAAVRDVLTAAGFTEVTTLPDLAGRPRVATGRRTAARPS
ncbi:peptide chain release factor N(5)-glutamine methyltransferase [Actinomycetospora lutea]|uniref:peptide chain release factor N(5)-glutamine methyltransferase n=1 Tax=Actinomycetospora lutea TaxID=663604 RepID=UPI0023651DC8|nr:peptide chain release factor N(5)-glutamine methyltransferase [Actinomycetospora lutea]MDD7941654.1 peptide chain release factor N(5)-glutamine methyltransferase [Actinomycetospora lutea]